MTSFMEEWNQKTDKLLAELLAKYRPYESEMLDDYGVLYEADFYFREGTSTCEEFLKAYDEFLRRIHHLND